MTTPSVEVVCDSALWSAVPTAERLATCAAEAALAAARPSLGRDAEISILLTDDAAIRALNRIWRGIDQATNVLSFPAAAPERLAGAAHLGDVAIAIETMRREAEAEGKTPADHLAHLVVHGVLHLLGHDHELESQAQTMEALEVAILAEFGIADPYKPKLADAVVEGH